MGILHNYHLSISDNCQKQVFGACSFAVLLKTHLLSTLFTNKRLLLPQKNKTASLQIMGQEKVIGYYKRRHLYLSNKSLWFRFAHAAKRWPMAKLQLVVMTTTMKVACIF